MTASAHTAKQPIPLALALGVLGGGALITTAWLTEAGPHILLSYGALGQCSKIENTPIEKPRLTVVWNDSNIWSR